MKSENELKRDDGCDCRDELINEERSVEREAADGGVDGFGGDSEELMKQLERYKAQTAELTDKYQRTLAEFDNFRKRTVKEKASMYSDGAFDVIKSLLHVIDSFDSAFASMENTRHEDSVYAGMSLIYKQLQQFMDENGISEIEAIGKTFDPLIHSAIDHTDDPNFGENEICGELQKGYKYKDRILRHSVVRVAN